MTAADDEDLLPAEDRCAYEQVWGCGKTRAEHDIPYLNGGPGHPFVEPERQPRPDRITGCDIQTDWTCTHCGEAQNVAGVAEGWMECADCGRDSYLVAGLDPTPTTDRLIQCVCDGGSHLAQLFPFLIHPDCQIHQTPTEGARLLDSPRASSGSESAPTIHIVPSVGTTPDREEEADDDRTDDEL